MTAKHLTTEAAGTNSVRRGGGASGVGFCNGLPWVILMIAAIPAALAEQAASQRAQTWPRYGELAAGRWRVQPLPGHGFTFTIYGCPGELTRLRQLVAVMREQELGNGFDPGPPALHRSKALFEYLAAVGWPVICYPG